jgi:PPOX class probable F420-dependent enzyme
MQIANVITPGNAESFTIGETRRADKLTDLDPVHLDLITGAVTATLATINEDGLPQLTPVWVNHDGQSLNLNSVRGRLKDRNMRARPRVSLMFVNNNNPYHWITIEGEVAEIIDEDDAERGAQATNNIDDLAELYLGQRPYPLRDPKGEIRVLYKVRPLRILKFGPVG